MKINNSETSIGIVGCGFVGSAVLNAYLKTCTRVLVFDPNKPDSVKDLSQLYECEAIFVCVPTPLGPSDECNVSILKETLDTLVPEYAYMRDGLVICKSTAPASFYSNYKRIVHVPEFLTQANAVEDYFNAKCHIIGSSCDAEFLRTVDVIRAGAHSDGAEFFHCTLTEAAMFKYMANCFLATKVAFMNEMYTYSNVVGADWVTMQNLMLTDPRFGTSHMQVPGPDGKRGFGGACFPKDMRAMVYEMNTSGVPSYVIEAALDSNARIRGKFNF